MAETVKELIDDIVKTRTQTSVSNKDEVRVMMGMLNDPTYKVDVYGRNGVETQYCPYEESRTLVAGIIKDTVKISANEAAELAGKYEFSKQNANVMIDLSKEFVNTYLHTGRKLSFGGREDSKISIARKVKTSNPAGPKKVGVNDDGSDKIVEGTGTIAQHASLRVYSPCPPWCK